MSQPAEGWAVYGIDLPEHFVFPVTTLGFAADVHGGGEYGTSPTRVDYHVHIETGSDPRKGPSRLEIIPSPNPHTGVEADVAWQFAQQLPLALWPTNLVRVSLLRFIALGRARKDVLESLDRAIFDSREADRLRVEAERYWETRGVDVASLFKADGAT